MIDKAVIQKLNALNAFFTQFCAAIDGQTADESALSWSKVEVELRRAMEV